MKKTNLISLPKNWKNTLQSAKKVEDLELQNANKIAEMTAELKQQSEILASVLELDRREKLTRVKSGYNNC